MARIIGIGPCKGVNLSVSGIVVCIGNRVAVESNSCLETFSRDIDYVTVEVIDEKMSACKDVFGELEVIFVENLEDGFSGF